MLEKKIELELRKFLAPEYVFGSGARMKAGNYCRRLGGRRVLLVSGSTLASSQWVKEVDQSIQEGGIETILFTAVSSNPRDYEVMNGADHYHHHNCNMIVAVGGGSAIDCAKGIGIVTANHNHILEFEGVDQIDRPMPPLVCVPTTAGSAADLSQFAIITNYNERYKMAIISKAVVPDVSLIDPEVLTSMDNFLTACTGVDALSHAFEAFVSNASSAFTDMYALEAIRIIWHNLPETLLNPVDMQLRGKTMLASLYAGLAFSNASLGCVHSLAHSLGGYLDLPHGECNSILLPHVVNFNFEAASERYREIARTIDIPVDALNDKQVKQQLFEKLTEFNRTLKILTTLNKKGVSIDMIPLLASKSIKDPCNATNPRVPEKKDLEAIISEAM